MTPQEEYVANKGYHCPSCDSDKLMIVDDIELIDDGNIYQKIKCNNCNSVWTDVYTLTGFSKFKRGKK